MIARAAIDARALIELLEEKPRAVLRNHVELTQSLRDYGILVLAGKEDEQALFDAVKKQRGEVKVLWVDTFKSLGRTARYRFTRPDSGRPMSSLCDEGLPGEVCSQMDLIVVGTETAVRKGFAEIGYGQPAGEPEQVMADSVSHCRIMTRFRELRDRGNYPKGTARAVIWADVFAPLARASSEATLLDRYLLRGLTERRNSLRHVAWILNQLDACLPTGANVRLLAELPDRLLSSSGYEALLRRSGLARQRTNIRTLQVALAPWVLTDGRGPHNRHIRFSCGSAIGVEEGFDRLSNDEVWGVDGFSWKHHTQAAALEGLHERERFVLRQDELVEVQLS